MLKSTGIIITALVFFSLSPPAYAQEKKYETASLPNGISVLTQSSGGDMAAACIFIKVGSFDETRDNNGVTTLLNRVLLSCYPGKTAPPPLLVEQLGGKVISVTSGGFTCFIISAPQKALGSALKITADSMAAPEFSDAAIAVERDSLAAEMGMRDDRAQERAYRIFLRKSCDGLPCGLYPDGDPAVISKLTRRDLKAWHEKYYRPERVFVSICGSITPKAASKMVEDSFRGWDRLKGGTPSDFPKPAPAVITGSTFEEQSSDEGAAAVIGYSALPAGSPDYAAMRLVKAVLAEGMGSSIFRSLREKGELAYSFGSLMPESDYASRMFFYLTTDEDRLAAAVDSVVKSVESLKAGKLTADELQRAKGKAMGEILMDRETAAARAYSAGLYELMGAGADYGERLAAQMEKLGKEEVVSAANRYMDKSTIVLLKPPQGK